MDKNQLIDALRESLANGEVDRESFICSYLGHGWPRRDLDKIWAQAQQPGNYAGGKGDK